MTIKNHPVTTDNPEINQMRYLIEQRAEWLYELCKEMEAQGMDYEQIARAAVSRFGCRRGQATVESLKGKGHDYLELAESLKNSPNTIVFEKDFIETSENRIEMDFHYCPLLACWQKLTNDNTEIAKLCDIAMDGDRCWFGSIPDSEFILANTLANGDPVCKLIIQKKTDHVDCE